MKRITTVNIVSNPRRTSIRNKICETVWTVLYEIEASCVKHVTSD